MTTPFTFCCGSTNSSHLCYILFAQPFFSYNTLMGCSVLYVPIFTRPYLLVSKINCRFKALFSNNIPVEQLHLKAVSLCFWKCVCLDCFHLLAQFNAVALSRGYRWCTQLPTKRAATLVSGTKTFFFIIVWFFSSFDVWHLTT